ncbi:uncharacterized protein METZ01_LOCUS274491, partial [marine metagenome]
MLLDKLKKILPDNNGNDYPEDFQQIIKNLYPGSVPDEEAITFIWEAYR